MHPVVPVLERRVSVNKRVLMFLRLVIFSVGVGVVALSAVGDVSFWTRYFGPLDLMLVTNGFGLILAAIVLRPNGLLFQFVHWLGGKIIALSVSYRFLGVFAFSLILLTGWVMAMEGVLAGGMYWKQNQIWPMYYATLAERNLPCWGAKLRPGTVSIAIFGESSAAGWGTNASFGQIMEKELPRRYQGHDICIVNFAENGSWFHGRQAELAKAVIKNFDIAIIYTGHNEMAQYYKSVTFLKPEFRGLPDRAIQLDRLPNPSLPAFVQQIELKSRLWAVFKRFLLPLFPQPVTRTAPVTPSEFEFSLALPEEAKAKILDNWEHDMVEIAEIAVQSRKLLILSSLPSNESYKPFYSVFKSGINPDEVQEFEVSYKCGVGESEKQHFDAAIACYKMALAIDDQPAILNWRIGTAEFLLGNRVLGREYLRRSIDQDGYFLRSISALHEKSRAVAQRYQNVVFVDPITAFHSVEDLGVNANDNFFIDMHHPSSLGNKILAEVFMCELARNKPFMDFEAGTPCVPFTAWNWDDELRQNFSAWDVRAAFWNVFQTSQLSAYREDFYSDSDKRLSKLDQIDRVVFARALLKAGYLQDKLEGVRLLNETLAMMSGDQATLIFSVPMPNSQTLIDAAREIGFSYSGSGGQFNYILPAN